MKSKGIIMEIRENSMIVMTQDCSFQEIKKREAVIEGMEIEYFPDEITMTKRKRLITAPVAVAAAIILLLVSSIYGIANWQNMMAPATAILTIDINPSIALELNHQQQVVRARALNSEAQAFPLVDLKGAAVQEAVLQIIDWAEKGGYIKTKEQNYILLTTVSLKQETTPQEELQKMVAELAKSIEENSTDEKQRVVLSLTSNQETLKQAKKKNISVGRLEITQQTRDKNADVNIEEAKTQKVKELIIKYEKKQHPVFENHPGDKNLQRDKNQREKDDDNTKNQNTRNPIRDKDHPVFETHPGRGKGSGRKQEKIEKGFDKEKHRDREDWEDWEDKEDREEKEDRNNRSNRGERKDRWDREDEEDRDDEEDKEDRRDRRDRKNRRDKEDKEDEEDREDD